jgi:probable HAF family extracellular repeat protein
MNCLIPNMIRIVALAGLTSAAVAADQYTVTVVPALPGGLGTVAGGVNDLGWVVGQADNASGELVAFVFRNGETQELPRLAGSGAAKAHSVNNAGTIVGECANADGTTRPVVWTEVEGVWVVNDLGTHDSQDRGFGVATRISPNGKITGYASREGPGAYHAFRVEGGVMTDVGTLSYSGPLAYSQGLGINDAGHVSGFAYMVLGGPEHGMFVGDRGGVDITPAERFGLAQWHAVNASDMLAGYVSASFTGGAFTPATYTQGGSITVIPVGGGLEEGYAYDLNDAGTVVGTNFTLAPFPEPNIFHAFAFSGGVTTDLNDAANGLPGVMTEAVDIAENGLIAGTADNGFAPVAVLLTPGTACGADFNRDGFVDFFDYDDFVACFEGSGCPDGTTADFNGDGFADFFDYDDFVNAFETGC